VSDDLERAVGPDRRTFVKRLVIGTAFAAPVVSTFTMTGVKAVFGSTPGAVTAGFNSNTTQPPGPSGFPDEVDCFLIDKSGGLEETLSDGPNTLNIVVPDGSLPPNTILCIYRGDLTALQADFPAGHTPTSAYAIVWHSPPGNSTPDSQNPIIFTVTGAAGVSLGDPIYKYDKGTGNPVLIPVPALPQGWGVTFVEDPAYVVVDVSDDAGAPSAVVAQPTTTG
jgi:hypothetical protein